MGIFGVNRGMHHRQPPPNKGSARGKPDGGGDVSVQRAADPGPRQIEFYHIMQNRT
jgi:hypothetical protein